MFRDFLLNRESYLAAEQYWQGTTTRLAEARDQGNEWQPWFGMTYPDKDRPLPGDGNPIFSARSHRLNRSIRIIQFAQRGGKPAFITAYIERGKGFPEVDLPKHELAIQIVLTTDTAKAAELILSTWMDRP